MKPNHGGRASPQREQLILVKSTCVPIEPHLALLLKAPPGAACAHSFAILSRVNYRKIGIAGRIGTNLHEIGLSRLLLNYINFILTLHSP